MKLKLLSDLHLEGRRGYQHKTHPWSQYAGEDVLVLAGDIAVGIDSVENAIMYFLNQGYPNIVYVMGNHEGYHSTFTGFIKELRTRFHNYPQVYILDCDSIAKIGDVSFFGGTLWTDFGGREEAIHMAKSWINDFRVIKDWDVQNSMDEFRRQSQFIKNAYAETSGKKVIVTHFLPTRNCVAERFKHSTIEKLLNYYFSNNLSAWAETLEDTIWLYGHTHDAQDHYEGNTRLISNPIGYSGEEVPEHAKFNPNFLLEI